MAPQKKKRKPDSGSHEHKKPSVQPLYRLGEDGLPVLDEDGNPVRIVKSKKKKGGASSKSSRHGAEVAVDGAADKAPAGNSSSSSSGNKTVDNAHSSSSSKKKSSSSSSSKKNNSSSSKGIAKSAASLSGSASAKSPVASHSKSKKKKPSAASLVPDGDADSGALSSSKKKKKTRPEGHMPVFDDDDALYSDAGVTYLPDGSVFFGVLSLCDEEVARGVVSRKPAKDAGVAQGSSSDGFEEISAETVMADKTFSMKDDPLNECGKEAHDDTCQHNGNASGDSDDGRGLPSHGETGCSEVVAAPSDAAASYDETTRAAALNATDAAIDQDPYAADCFVSGRSEGADDKSFLDGSAAGATADTVASGGAGVPAGECAAADGNSQHGVRDSEVKSEAVGESAEQANADVAASDAKSSSSSSSSTAVAALSSASLVDVRHLRPSRSLHPAPQTSSSGARYTSPYSALKSNADHVSAGNKPATPLVEVDNLFIRTAVAPSNECFNPVFHFQRYVNRSKADWHLSPH